MITSTYQKDAHANEALSKGVRSPNADGRYGNLSPEAKFLYALMPDRVRLSERNGWRDKSGRTFIRFSANDAARLLGVSESKVRRAFRELESPGLIRREKQGQGRPDRVFVRTFEKPDSGKAAGSYG